MRSAGILILLCLTLTCVGQELNCVVTINSTQVQTSDRNVFKDMKTNVEQFMNGRKWTSDNFKNYEKIACSILITVSTPTTASIGSYTASVQVRSARPVFNTNY